MTKRTIATVIWAAFFLMLCGYFASAQEIQAGYINSNGSDSGYLSYNHSYQTSFNAYSATLEFLRKDNQTSSELALQYSEKINGSYNFKAGLNAELNPRINLKKAGLSAAVSYQIQTDDWTHVYADLGLDASIIADQKSEFKPYVETGLTADFERTKLGISQFQMKGYTKFSAFINYHFSRIDKMDAFIKYIRTEHNFQHDYLFTTGLEVKI